uniref:RPA43 OB domain-containing protein n=1 Tax=Clastoptera arizonana TaxID=38151 RepID=A0A1B6DAZ5_9HEMI
MGSNIVFQISINELKTLINDQNSCINICQKCKRNLQFLPGQTKNFKNSIKESLGTTIGTYESELDGIILNYTNVKIQPFTKLKEDGYMSITYIADVYVFSPKINSTLKGVVNKKSEDHVGCLVHKIFNAVIPRPKNTNYTNWSGRNLNIGDDVIFKVACLNLNSHLPYIRGNLYSDIDYDTTDSGIEGSEKNIEHLNDIFSLNAISKLINPNVDLEDDLHMIKKVTTHDPYNFHPLNESSKVKGIDQKKTMNEDIIYNISTGFNFQAELDTGKMSYLMKNDENSINDTQGLSLSIPEIPFQNSSINCKNLIKTANKDKKSTTFKSILKPQANISKGKELCLSPSKQSSSNEKFENDFLNTPTKQRKKVRKKLSFSNGEEKQVENVSNSLIKKKNYSSSSDSDSLKTKQGKGSSSSESEIFQDKLLISKHNYKVREKNVPSYSSENELEGDKSLLSKHSCKVKEEHKNSSFEENENVKDKSLKPNCKSRRKNDISDTPKSKMAQKNPIFKEKEESSDSSEIEIEKVLEQSSSQFLKSTKLPSSSSSGATKSINMKILDKFLQKDKIHNVVTVSNNIIQEKCLPTEKSFSKKTNKSKDKKIKKVKNIKGKTKDSNLMSLLLSKAASELSKNKPTDRISIKNKNAKKHTKIDNFSTENISSIFLEDAHKSKSLLLKPTETDEALKSNTKKISNKQTSSAALKDHPTDKIEPICIIKSPLEFDQISDNVDKNITKKNIQAEFETKFILDQPHSYTFPVSKTDNERNLKSNNKRKKIL